jgi:hypothetical protein
MATTALNHLITPILRSNGHDSNVTSGLAPSTTIPGAGDGNSPNPYGAHGAQPHASPVSISEIARDTDFGHSSQLRPDDFVLLKTLGTGKDGWCWTPPVRCGASDDEQWLTDSCAQGRLRAYG